MESIIVGIVCLAVGTGAGYLLGKKKKVMSQLRAKRDEILEDLARKREATKEDLINIIKEKL